MKFHHDFTEVPLQCQKFVIAKKLIQDSGLDSYM